MVKLNAQSSSDWCVRPWLSHMGLLGIRPSWSSGFPLLPHHGQRADWALLMTLRVYVIGLPSSQAYNAIN